MYMIKTLLAKTIRPQGLVGMLYQQKEDKKCWENNISEWTGLKLGDALRKSKNGVKY